MVNTAGEASGTVQKRQRLDGAEGSANAERGLVARSGTLFDLEILECPICCEPLSSRIFQCENGHVVCSGCCTQLRSKCPFCRSPIGNIRCRRMERVVEAITFPCSNAKSGCTEKLSYDKGLAHEKECKFALCYCPAPTCTYSGLYKDLYNHYDVNHKNEDPWAHVRCGQYTTSALLLISEKIHVLQNFGDDNSLVVVQSFKEPQGVFVTVNCIAPLAAGVGDFYYDLSYTIADNTVTYGSHEMNKILKVSFETPEKDFMFVPYYFLNQCPTLKLEICIHKIVRYDYEEEADEEEGVGEEGDEEEDDDEEE